MKPQVHYEEQHFSPLESTHLSSKLQLLHFFHSFSPLIHSKSPNFQSMSQRSYLLPQLRDFLFFLSDYIPSFQKCQMLPTMRILHIIPSKKVAGLVPITNATSFATYRNLHPGFSRVKALLIFVGRLHWQATPLYFDVEIEL